VAAAARSPFYRWSNACVCSWGAVEDEMKRTQINKATEGHLGRLKAKLAKLRTEVRPALLLSPPFGRWC
jgi:hypothetical protein